MGSSGRLLLNQLTHSRVACSTASKDFQGPRLWMTWAFCAEQPIFVATDETVAQRDG